MHKAVASVLMLIMLMMTERLAFGGLSGWGGIDQVRQVGAAIDSTMKQCFSISEAECNRRLDGITELEGGLDHAGVLKGMVYIAQNNIVERDPYAAQKYYGVVRRYAAYRFGPESPEAGYVTDKLATVQLSTTVDSDNAARYSPEEIYSPGEIYSGIGDDGSLVFSDDPAKLPKSARKGKGKSSRAAGKTKGSKGTSEIVGTWYRQQSENDGTRKYAEITFDDDGVQTYFVEVSVPGGAKRRYVTTARYIFRDGMVSLTSKQPPENYTVKVDGDSLAIRSTSGPHTIVYQRKK